MLYFGEPVGRVKIQTTSKHSQRYYTTKRLIRDLLSNTPNCYVRGGELREYFIYGGMRGTSMRSGTKLAREIQLTDWSTAGNLSNRSSGVQIPRDICTRFGRYLYSTKCSWIIRIIILVFFFNRAVPRMGLPFVPTLLGSITYILLSIVFVCCFGGVYFVFFLPLFTCNLW